MQGYRYLVQVGTMKAVFYLVILICSTQSFAGEPISSVDEQKRIAADRAKPDVKACSAVGEAMPPIVVALESGPRERNKVFLSVKDSVQHYESFSAFKCGDKVLHYVPLGDGASLLLEMHYRNNECFLTTSEIHYGKAIFPKEECRPKRK